MKRFRKGLALVSILTLMVSMPVSAKTNIFVSTNAAVSNNAGDMDEEDDLELVCSSSRRINGITFSISFSRRPNAKDTTDKHIEILEDLFYQVYPQLYDRFGGYSKAPTKIAVEIVPGFQHAGQAFADKILLKDNSYNNDVGYDVFTHELGHLVCFKWDETKKKYLFWDKSKIEYDKYSENFAEYCRYVYGYENGKHNDKGWELKDIYKQGSRDNSDRFFLWLDWETSSSNKDFMRDFFEICCDGSYSRDQWKDKVWPMLFKGTRFEGRSIDDVWKEYRNGDFSHYGSKSTNGYTPEMIRECKRGGEDIRTYLKKHSFSQRYEEGL